MTVTRWLSAVWILTVALTTTTWLEGNQATSAPVRVLLVVLTMVKATAVVLVYMEVRRAPWWLVAACGAWIAVVTATLLVLVS